MSFVGCNFICKNEECSCANTAFTLTGPWPLGNIDTIIEKYEEGDFKDHVKQRKALGYEYIKINYPNEYEIPIIGYSIEKFCPTCKRIQTFDVKDTADETPEICDVCNYEYVTFQEACDDENGLKCPFCDEKLFQNRWYVNEKEADDEDVEEETNECD